MDVAIARLMQEVFDRPDDDGVRSVVSDALIERGDPRGEFIALQLADPHLMTDDQRRRMIELERAYGHQWAGLPEVDTVEFRRGFPALVRTSACTDAEAWATVETLVVSHQVQAVGPFLSASPHCRSLRRIINLRAAELTTSATWKTPRLHALELAHEITEAAVAGVLARPSITELAFALADGAKVPPRWFWNPTLTRQLQLVRVRTLGGAHSLTEVARQARKGGPIIRYESFLGFSVEFAGDTLIARMAWPDQLEGVADSLFALISANVPSVAKRFELSRSGPPAFRSHCGPTSLDPRLPQVVPHE